MGLTRILSVLLFTAILAVAQFVELRPAPPVSVPFLVDSNTATFWSGGRLHLFSSSGTPMISDGSQDGASTQEVVLDTDEHMPMWIESVWVDSDGTIFGWYHHEREHVCPGSTLTVPEIGAIVSVDQGRSFKDLGIILNSGDPVDCTAQNGYFASGHGDFSVILDREHRYFYFLFSSYGGDVTGQGVGIARMPFLSRRFPVGTVRKYHNGEWFEPGLGGQLTPILPARAAWQRPDTDAFWGPSIHWNTYLRKYVVLLNRSCCNPQWPQEGIYLTMNSSLSNPEAWTEPVKILEGGDWYPWVLGLGPGETSQQAGQAMRLYVRGVSEWEMVFHLDEPSPLALQLNP